LTHVKKERTVERGDKKVLVDTLRSELEDQGLLVVTQQSGMTVAQTQALRRKMRESAAHYKVAKNTLVRLAVKGTAYEVVSDYLKGPTAIAYSKDPVAAAKAAVDFSKTNDKLQVVCGVLGDKFLDAQGVKTLAALPSLDELRGKIIGVIQAPATKVAGVVAAPAAQLARVISAYAKK
jgi:large subunit ribosomal protein L10